MKASDILADRYLLLKVQSEDPLVYICMDQSTQKMVILRYVTATDQGPPGGRRGENEVGPARYEFAMLQALSHPNLPRAQGEVESEGQLFLVVEYAPGTSLADLVAAEGPRKVTQAMDMARALVSVLTYLHQQDPPVVCRNLDPNHIVRRKNGQLTLVDSGLAPVGSPVATEALVPLPPFAAPEQASGPTTVRSNVYSLGATLYFLLTGEPPGSASVPAGAAEAAELLRVIQPMLAPNPDDRPATFEALAAAAAKPLVSSAPPPVPSPPAPAAMPPRSPSPVPVPVLAAPLPAVPAAVPPPSFSPAPVAERTPEPEPSLPLPGLPAFLEVAVPALFTPLPPPELSDMPSPKPGSFDTDTRIHEVPLHLPPETQSHDAPRLGGAETSSTSTPGETRNHDDGSPAGGDTRAGEDQAGPGADALRDVREPLPSGTILNDRFRIEGIVGEGGMGAVYLSTHLELDQKVAIKEMRLPSLDPGTREVCVRQFKVEARILNRLHHPNLPRVYDFFQVGERYYLVMDFILGDTLEDVPQPSCETVMRWAGELCNVLEYLHSQEPPVVFRDLKPANIMQCADGTIRLIDFGIAKVFDKDKEAAGSKTMLHGFGSHGYAAPEQYGETTDQRVDVYGLGATLYALLSGLTPPPSVDRVGGVATLLPLRSVRPDVPEQVDQAVEWMLQLPRNQRPQTMDECRRALGLASAEAARTALPGSTPRRIRQWLREEFQNFCPAPWLDVGGVLRELQDAVTGSAAPPIIYLTGRSGSGKSRMLREVSGRVAPALRVLPPVRGGRMVRQRPLGALWPALAALVRDLGQPLLLALVYRLDAPAIQELSQFFPQLRELAASAPVPPLSPLDRSRVLLDACRATIEEAVTLQRGTDPHRRWLWCVDDAHWLDPATVRLLGSLLERELPMTMVLASEPGVEDDAALEALTRWRKRLRVVELSPEPWSRSDVATFLQSSLPPIDGLESQIDTLHQVSGGSVLLLEELLRWLVMRRFVEETEGVLRMRPLHQESLPATVAEAVRGRAELQTLETRQMLSAAAVIGPRFEADALARLLFGDGAEVDGPAVLPGVLSRAAEALFLRSSEEGVWEFISEPTRQVFYDLLNGEQRRFLHRAMGHLQESSESNLLTSDRAYHLEQAGDVEGSLSALSALSHDLLTPTTVEAIIREAPGSKEWFAVAELSPDQLERTTQVCAGMARSFKSLGRYSGDSPIVKTSLESTMAMLRELGAELGALLFNCAENFFSLNGQQVDVRQLPPDLAAACKRHRIGGFEVRAGLDVVELTRFLTLLNASHDVVVREGGWAATMKARQITTIQVIENVLVEVSERDLFDPAKLRDAREVVLKTDSRSGEEAGEGLVSSKAVSTQLECIRDLLEQVKSGAAAPRPVAKDPDLEEAWGTLNKQAQREEIMLLAALCRKVDRPLMSYLDERPHQLLPHIESEDREQRVLAAMALLHGGVAARNLLVNYLATSDSVLGRAVALFILSRQVDHPETVIIGRLLESFDEQEVVRLLSALREGRLPWEHVLEILLLSPSSSVRWATARHLVATDIDNLVKTEILRKTLKAENLHVVMDTLRAVGELADSELVPDVGKLLDRGWGKSTPESLRVQVQACHVLAQIGSPEAVMPILKPIVARGYKAALLGGWESEVRCAATLALGRLHCDEGRELLASLLKDADTGVRSAAQLALSLSPSQEKENLREGNPSLQVP